jgi:hypothetical protein
VVVSEAFDLAAAYALYVREFTIQNKRDEIDGKNTMGTDTRGNRNMGWELKLSGDDRSRSTSMVDRSMAVKW